MNHKQQQQKNDLVGLRLALALVEKIIKIEKKKKKKEIKITFQFKLCTRFAYVVAGSKLYSVIANTCYMKPRTSELSACVL